jgi:hypothetical protein
MTKKPDQPQLADAQAVKPPKHRHPTNLRGWYAQAKYLTNQFVPLAVLQTLSQLADDDGVCSLVEAKQEVNQEILFAMLRMLTLMGHIDVDGERIIIKSIPTTKDTHQ